MAFTNIFQKNPAHAVTAFGQKNTSLYLNQPRLPFEFYISINLNNVDSAKDYITQFFTAPELQQIGPLVKSIDMPSMKIETAALNQYNRKRMSQSKINFDPVKLVLHDVADGKTLRLWEMYYRYYFGDGNEPGINMDRQSSSSSNSYSTENLPSANTIPGANYNPSVNGQTNGSTLGQIRPNSTSAQFNNMPVPYDTVGTKSTTQNIIADTLNSQLFGLNLSRIQNVRSLIKSIDIYQVHGKRFNQVTLVNPRITAFTHDTLNYAVGDKTLEISFTLEYEYAYYTFQNMLLGGMEVNNTSSLVPFLNGNYLELPQTSFSVSLINQTQSTPITTIGNLPSIISSTQAKLGTLSESTFPLIQDAKTASTSVLQGIQVAKEAVKTAAAPIIEAKNFISGAAQTANQEYRNARTIYNDVTGQVKQIKNLYQDIKRIKIGTYLE